MWLVEIGENMNQGACFWHEVNVNTFVILIFTSNRFEAKSGLFLRTQQRRPLRRQRSLPSLHQAEPAPQSQTVINDEAIQKISALESELAKLRQQIAQIVQAQEQSAQSAGKSYSLSKPYSL